MDNTVIQLVVSQLSYRIPTLLACAFGFVLALIYFRRCRTSALLVMLATGLMAAASLGTGIVQALLMQGRAAGVGNQDMARYAQMMGLVGVLGSIVHAGALALLLIAVFAGRRGEEP